MRHCADITWSDVLTCSNTQRVQSHEIYKEGEIYSHFLVKAQPSVSEQFGPCLINKVYHPFSLAA